MTGKATDPKPAERTAENRSKPEEDLSRGSSNTDQATSAPDKPHSEKSGRGDKRDRSWRKKPHPGTREPGGKRKDEPTEGEQEDDDEMDEDSAKPKKWFGGLVKDLLVSGGIVVSLLLILYLYTGVWPPMVVIESQSMMHGDDSQIGIIDTGDLTLVKAVDDRNDIVTYVEATCRTSPDYGYMTYGDYGNVIVYRKNGMTDTPVIHRAIAWLEYNDTATRETNQYRGDLPDIGIYNATEYTVPGIKCYYTGYRSGTPFLIRISLILQNMAHYGPPHNGFVTHGDHNIPWVDQEVLTDATGRKVEPVKPEWVVGKAEGELPWFGLFKLWITGHNTSTFPPSSVNGLVITVVILVVAPIIIDYLMAKRKKMRQTRKDARGKKPESGEKRPGP